MTPAFQILANGADVTGSFRDRLIELEIVDEDGDKADRVRIVVDDRFDLVAAPEKDTIIQVWLGYVETGLSLMGQYAVDGGAGEGPVRRLTIRATAADMKGGIRAPRTRAWQDKTLADIARTIAGETGLRAVVSRALADIRWPYLAQTAESNLHFLRRIAASLDATAKPAGGTLLVARRGDDITAAGDPMPNGVIDLFGLVSWSWDEDGREKVGRVEAEWSDVDAAQRRIVTVGSEEPTTRLRHVYGTQQEAQRAAEAEYRRRARGQTTLSAELSRFAPDLIAGARMTLQGVSTKCDGQWDVTRVTHTLSVGLRTAVEAKRGGM
ncbi:Phage late control gene D protein (GPD) [Paracoccus haematequi]|uniref:Phage late control gene D protein (GPD) n=1 Tax=Paracoccus haematequi TaxID=2491866 RepID=A0A3S4CKJ0_9RHOB|nr:contractile injection system protein, VgrG/Pvc8 family [Paracoccus haematequi]VDS09236.1 Phage late control gene D protein (GPD) [Paracoccus haematequi]